MRTLGLVGGTGWVSTLEYYRLLNEEVNRRLGGHEAARCIVYSFNFGDVMRAKLGDPEQRRVAPMVADAAWRLSLAGADAIMLCANTLHMFAERVAAAADRPLIHIADAAAVRVRSTGLARVGLLGTRPTMERTFYRARLERAGLDVLVPDQAGRSFVDEAIYGELVRGRFEDATRRGFLAVIQALRNQGAEGIVLACTEIPLLVRQDDCEVPLFDTLRIHVDAAVDFMLAEAETPGMPVLTS